MNGTPRRTEGEKTVDLKYAIQRLRRAYAMYPEIFMLDYSEVITEHSEARTIAISWRDGASGDGGMVGTCTERDKIPFVAAILDEMKTLRSRQMRFPIKPSRREFATL